MNQNVAHSFIWSPWTHTGGFYQWMQSILHHRQVNIQRGNAPNSTSMSKYPISRHINWMWWSWNKKVKMHLGPWTFCQWLNIDVDVLYLCICYTPVCSRQRDPSSLTLPKVSFLFTLIRNRGCRSSPSLWGKQWLRILLQEFDCRRSKPKIAYFGLFYDAQSNNLSWPHVH